MIWDQCPPFPLLWCYYHPLGSIQPNVFSAHASLALWDAEVLVFKILLQIPSIPVEDVHNILIHSDPISLISRGVSTLQVFWQILYNFSSFMWAICPVHLFLLDLIILIITPYFGKQNENKNTRRSWLVTGHSIAHWNM